jgi:Ca2+-transporting ATPase
MWVRLFAIGVVAALFTIAAYQWTIVTYGSTISAQSMAMVIFSMLHIPISISLRHPRQTAFRSETFSNKALLMAYGWVILILILATELSFFQRILDTEPLTTQQWGICFVAALVFFFVGEFIKWGFRLFSKSEE